MTAALLALALAGAPEVRLSTTQVMAPADLTVTVRIPPDPDDRSFCLVAVGTRTSRSSCEQLNNLPPQCLDTPDRPECREREYRQIRWRVHPGVYEVFVVVQQTGDRERRSQHIPLTVLDPGTGEP
jgi:hypothetical protein